MLYTDKMKRENLERIRKTLEDLQSELVDLDQYLPETESWRSEVCFRFDPEQLDFHLFRLAEGIEHYLKNEEFDTERADWVPMEEPAWTDLA